MKFILNWLVTTLAVVITAYLINGFLAGAVTISSAWSALIVALVMGIVNALVRPVLHFIALPLTIITLGLFAFVVNAVSVMLVSYLSPGFEVAGFWVALIFSVIMSVISWALHKIA